MENNIENTEKKNIDYYNHQIRILIVDCLKLISKYDIVYDSYGFDFNKVWRTNKEIELDKFLKNTTDCLLGIYPLLNTIVIKTDIETVNRNLCKKLLKILFDEILKLKCHIGDWIDCGSLNIINSNENELLNTLDEYINMINGKLLTTY